MCPQPPPSQPPHGVDRRALDLLAAGTHGRLSMSLRALPFSAPARHVVADDNNLLLRLHGGYGYHRACDGNVIGYGAQDLTGGGHGWSVQLVGTARVARPSARERRRLGPAPRFADGEPYDPVWLRVVPRFATVHTLGDGTAPPRERPGADGPQRPWLPGQRRPA